MKKSSKNRGVAPGVMTDVWQHLRARDQRPRPSARNALRVVNQDESTDLYLYDEIGYWGTTAQDFVDTLRGIDAKSINVHVNSPGGDVFDGVAIYNALADHPATVNVVVDALAASAASFIAMAGDTVRMNRASQMMIHDAAGLCIGNAADMAEMKDLLDRVSDMIAGIYADRAGEDVAFWRDLMIAETWYSAAEAVEAGLADVAGAAEDPAGDPEADPEADPEEDPAEDDPAEDDPAEDDPVEDPEATARKHLAVSGFTYAGRAQAPAPPTKASGSFKFDPAAFRQAVREGIRS